MISLKKYKSGESAALEEELHNLENKLTEQYCQMGKTVLELAENEKAVTDKLVDEIIEIRLRLSAEREELECESCACLNDSDSLYCKRCGNKF